MQRCSHCGHYGDRNTHYRSKKSMRDKKKCRRPSLRSRHQGNRQESGHGPKIDPRFDPCEDYVYSKFHDETSIRLLVLLPGEPEDLIECTLQVEPIRRHSPYQAISYTWGERYDRADILCEGKRLDVPRNLMDALRKFRRRKRARLLWADAVCIDQSDAHERGHQVQMMGRIFKQAQTVLIWLGRDEGIDTKTLFRQFRRVSAIWSCCRDRSTWYRIFDDFKVTTSEGLYPFCHYPWFSRLWILQEVGLAAHAIVHCGKYDISFPDLMNGFSFLFTFEGHVKLKGGINIRGSALKILTAGFLYGPATFKNPLGVIARGISQYCTDPRDRIYALLGHPTFKYTLANCNSSSFLPVDYTICATELYLRFAKLMIGPPPSLEVLQYVRHDSSTILSFDSPSWVPQWDQPGRVGTLDSKDKNYYRAHAGMSAEYRLSDRTLSVAGFVFDKIIWRSDTFARFSVPEDPTHAPSKQNPHPLTQIWSYFGRHALASGVAEAAAVALCAPSDEYTLRSAPGERDRSSMTHSLTLSFVAYSVEMGIEIPGVDVTSLEGNSSQFADWRLTKHQCLFVTERGWIGKGPQVSSIGDEVCIIFGRMTPFVVHELPSVGESIYRLCGECYVHGIMQGEAVAMWEEGHLESKTFNLV